MNKKYELTDEVKLVNGVEVHRIKALKDFVDVRAGDLGGWIEKEDNLSHEGNCWVGDEAIVYGNAKIKDRRGTLTRARRKGLISLLKYIRAYFES